MAHTADLAGRIAIAKGRLRRALLAGGDTAGLHAELAALRAEAERAAEVARAEAAWAEAERARLVQQRTDEAAARHVAAAARRLEDLLTPLAPAPAPTRHHEASTP
jgi:hypothetical protein